MTLEARSVYRSVVRFAALMLVAGVVAVGGSAGAATGPTTTTTTTTPTTTTTTPSGSVFISFGAGGGFSIGPVGSRLIGPSGPFGSTVLLRGVARRSTAGQVQLRVFQGALSTPATPGFPGILAASCLPDREVVVDVSTDAIAGSVTFYARSSQQVGPQGALVGETEASPVAVVAAQVPSGTRAALVRFTGGPTDRAAPAGGWVVLAAKVKAQPLVHRPVPLLTDTTNAPPLGTLSIIDRAGRSHQLGSVPDAVGYSIPSSCVPRPPGPGSTSQLITPTTTPSTLPQPTGPGPADPTRARQAIETAYRRVFESPAHRNNNRYLEGGAVLTPTESAQLIAGYGDILGKIRVRINDFRFLSPTRAALSFDLLLNGQPISPTTIGQAALVGGQWKVTRDSFCAVIKRSNIACG
jgi:hypothetical protein